MKKKKSLEYYKDFCCGCGLCAEDGVKFRYTERFIEPELLESNYEFCEKYCLSNHQFAKKFWEQSVWGSFFSLHLGYANDEELRYRASSGGTISAILIYLLETGKISGVIHTAADPEKPWRTKTFYSVTKEEILNRCGSRYAQSAPLRDVLAFMEPQKQYAYVGKPCDVLALRKYMESNNNTQIVCYLSFFCAGVPSEKANIELLRALGCEREKECKELLYRGNGWPGFSTVELKNGYKGKLDYNSSWGKILGRDIRTMCRFCMIGTGEYADISCGDAWYLDDKGYPDFSEYKGRNIILSRSTRGEKILYKAVEEGYVKLDKCEDVLCIEKMQPFQYERKGTMKEKVFAMKLLQREVPNDSWKMLKSLKTTVTIKRRWAIFRGTIGRIVRNVI